MAINFPDSPTNGQVYTVGSRAWVWDSAYSVWNSTSVIDTSVTPETLMGVYN
jgi:hypothetical protein